MIKKSTKLIIDGKAEDIKGGMPLCKGDKITLDNKEVEVIDKKTKIKKDKEDFIVETTYILE